MIQVLAKDSPIHNCKINRKYLLIPLLLVSSLHLKVVKYNVGEMVKRLVTDDAVGAVDDLS